MNIDVSRTADFGVNGCGDAAPWEAAPWLELTRVGGVRDYRTRAKLLHSDTGLYVLVDCEDHILTTTGLPDNAPLFKEDVVEIFLWPDESMPVYLEYEISPLGSELPILVPQINGAYMGWLPWLYEGERKTRKAVRVRGGKQEPGAAATGWTVEVFIPYALLAPLSNVPCAAGASWRANIYRIDHDDDQVTHWAWSSGTGIDFHRMADFGRLRFTEVT